MKEFKSYVILKTFLEEGKNIVLVEGRVVLGYETNPKRIVKTQFNTVRMYDNITGLYLGDVCWDENTTEIKEL
jgi:hypothetical protein